MEECEGIGFHQSCREKKITIKLSGRNHRATNIRTTMCCHAIFHWKQCVFCDWDRNHNWFIHSKHFIFKESSMIKEISQSIAKMNISWNAEQRQWHLQSGGFWIIHLINSYLGCISHIYMNAHLDCASYFAGLSRRATLITTNRTAQFSVWTM